jgi:hypothetical protein
MNCAEWVAEHVNGETVVAAGLFQRRGTAAIIGDEGGLPSGADPEREAPGFPSNTIVAVTDGRALYAFHRDPHDGLIGRWPLGEVGAKLDARESNLNYLEIVGMWELLLSFPDGRSAAFECSKRNDDCKATCHAIAAGAAELTRNLPRPRSLDPDFTDWDPDDMDTWDERIVLVADDDDFLDWQRDWLTENGRG